MLPWPSLPHLLRDRARHHPDREALRFEGVSLTVAGLDAAVSRWAHLLEGAGIGPGERVAICLANGLDVPAAWLGAAAAGAVVVPLNVTARDADLVHVLNDSGAVAVVTGESRAEDLARLRSRCPDLREILVLAPVAPLGTTAAADALADAPPARDLPLIEPTDLVTLQYTSGTTGFPKGCMLTHAYWLRLGLGAVEYVRLAPSDVLLSAAPYYYMDPTWNLVAALAVGAPLVLLPRFSASTFWQQVADNGVTFFYCLGTMPMMLLKQPENPAVERGHRVRAVLCSGIVPDRQATFETRWGCPWREVYGTTEIGAGLMMPIEDTGSVGSGSMGYPVAGREARVADPKTGLPVEPGAVGELQFRGPDMMLGYWKRVDATTEYFHDGWAHTGDLVRRDADGGYHLVGRLKDMIRRGGENIAAAEVEAVLVAHPAVRAAACLAVPDEIRGEEVKACVQLQPGVTPAEAPPPAILGFVAGHLAPFKVPRYLEYVDGFPMTPSERIAKHELMAARPDLRAGSWDAVANAWIAPHG